RADAASLGVLEYVWWIWISFSFSSLSSCRRSFPMLAFPIRTTRSGGRQLMGILDNAKQVAKAVEEIHNLELYQRVLGLHSDIIELVEENNKLRDENKELKAVVALTKAMSFKPPFFISKFVIFLD